MALAEATVLCKFCNPTTDKVGPTFLHKTFSKHVVEYEIPHMHWTVRFPRNIWGMDILKVRYEIRRQIGRDQSVFRESCNQVLYHCTCQKSWRGN